jgi:transcriptional regulator with XRE-family HTH domain
MSIGSRIRELRLGQKPRLTQKALAKRARLSQTTISDLERGRNVSSTDLAAIAQALGVTAEYLTGGGERPAPVQEQLPLTDDFALLAQLWGRLTGKQRADKLHEIEELVAENTTLVAELGHIIPSIDRPVTNARVEKHLPARPDRSVRIKEIKP